MRIRPHFDGTPEIVFDCAVHDHAFAAVTHGGFDYEGVAEDFALCLCATGQLMRSTQNVSVKRTQDGYPLWMLWCEREGVARDRVIRLEDVLTADELRARGLVAAGANELNAVIAAGRKR